MQIKLSFTCKSPQHTGLTSHMECESTSVSRTVANSLTVSDVIDILTVCLSVCVCVQRGCSWGGTRLVTRDLHTIEPRTPRGMFENFGHGLAGSF